MIKYILSLLVIFSPYLTALPRGSSAPYISGDTFRAYCDFTYDELSKEMDPLQVKKGDLIFVKTDYIEEFFTLVHPKIKHKYILITHNGDLPVPRKCGMYLNDPKLIAWFGQNVEDCTHPKLKPIPIGIANKCWGHGNTDLIQKMQKMPSSSAKKSWLYLNFSVSTFPERSQVFELFKDKAYCKVSTPKGFSTYLQDLKEVKFILSPRGNGLDTHRTWEALLMGAIPIVKTSSLDPLYEDLPVIIIESWQEVNLTFLKQKYKELKTKTYTIEKMYVDYWLNLIDSYREG